MKRNRRSVRELKLHECKGENKIVPNISHSAESHPTEEIVPVGSNLYGSLDTVFDILVPLEARAISPLISHEHCSGGDSKLIACEKRRNPKFHTCDRCGKVEDKCECIGCGDFEEFVTFEGNETFLDVGNIDSKPLKFKADDESFEYELIDTLSDQHINSEPGESFGLIALSEAIREEDSADADSDQGEIFKIQINKLDSLSKHNLIVDDSDNEDIVQDRTEPIEEEINMVDSQDDLDLSEDSDLEPIKDDELALGFEDELIDQEALDNANTDTQDRVDDETGAVEDQTLYSEGLDYGSPEDESPTSPENDAADTSESKMQPEDTRIPTEENSTPTEDEVTAPVEDAPGEPAEPPIEALGSMGDTQPDEVKLEAALVSDLTTTIDKRSDAGDEEERCESLISQVPVTDTAVLAELKEADEQALKTALLLTQMKDSIAAFQEKELSEEDTIILKIKQAELMKKLAEFEEITQRIQRLVGLTELTAPKVHTPSQITEIEEEEPPSPPPEYRHRKEEDIIRFKKVQDAIPKIIVCSTDSHVPRIIVCETQKKGPPPHAICPCPPIVKPNVCSCPPGIDPNSTPCPPELMMSLTGRLSESYSMQEKLATDNAELESGRYHLQEELLQKDTTVEVLQRRVGSLQSEMRIIAKENSILNEKLTQISMDCMCGKKPSKPAPPPPGCMCVDPQMQQYSQNSAQLEHQLHQIEGEVKSMQCELIQVQRERQHLEQQRKLLKCTGPPPPPPSRCIPCCTGTTRDRDNPEQALRELKEQYARLQDDYKNKVSEVAMLRRESDKLKCICEKAQEAQVTAEAQCRCVQNQLRGAEMETKKLAGSREQMMEQEQQLTIAKQRYREAQDELEELRALVQDQTSQLEDYRNKYLQAQQQVEEQRRQIEVMEMDNNRITDQVNLEIQRVKNQFQEKLQELTPLPDILKATQLKLQEAQQMRLMAERNCDDMSRELQETKNKLAALTKEMDDFRNSQNLGTDEREQMHAKIEAWEQRYNELKEEASRIRAELARMEEIACQSQSRLEEKMHEATQLASQLDTVREESARQVARTKDRSETMRRSLQSQISELERQLAQSRAAARAAQKDRDEIRQRMQCQINNLNESFDQAQMRIRSLQSHVNFLKTSYTNIFESGNLMECPTPAAQPNYGLDSCDCNF